MSWRTVVVTQHAKLDLKMGHLVVRGEETNRILLDDIGVLIIENPAVSLTGCLLEECAAKKIKVIFCDSKRNPCFEMMPYYGCHDSSQKIKYQIAWDETTKESVSTEIIAEKIMKQKFVLEKFGKNDEASMLDEYAKNILPGDASNREGHSAKVYFNALFGRGFTRSADNAINAALNYGYSIILSMFNREIVANGYLTQIGIYHDNMFNQFNLSCDLMEPFRPIVDIIVKEMSPSVFEREEKLELISVLNEQLLIDKKMEYLPRVIAIYSRSVFNALNNKDIAELKFYSYE